jgi:molybdenum cofactor cytidylyltransferase
MNLIHALKLNLDPTRPDVVALVGGGGKTSTLFRLANEIASRGERVITTTTTRIFAAQMAQSPARLAVIDGRLDWGRLDGILAEHGQCLLVMVVEGTKAVGLDPRIVDELTRRAVDFNLAAILVEADGSRNLPLKAPAAHEPVVPDSTTLLVPILGLDALGAPADADHVHRPEKVQALLGIDAMTRITPEMAARLLIDPSGGAKGKPGGARLLPLLNKAENSPRLAGGRIIARLLAESGQPSLLGITGLAGDEPIRERWGSLAAVILAAGEGRRMGEAKQLLTLDGEPLVARAARLALESDAHHVLIVIGAHATAVRSALEPLRSRAGERLRLIHNDAWATGQSTSVRAAVDALAAEVEAALFFPVDQPNVPVSLLRVLWDHWRMGANLVAPRVEEEIRGAPALFDRIYWPDLRRLEGDQGGRPILKKRSAEVATVATPAHWLQDVDTAEEWAQMVSGDW